MTGLEIKPLPTGTIDMSFYRQQAKQARAEAIQMGMQALGRWIKAKLHIERPVTLSHRLGH